VSAAAVILFVETMQILALSELTTLWQGAVVLEGVEGQGVGGLLVDGHDAQ
jgi:hypothetical protein